MDYPAFLQWLHNLLPSPNIFYAIRNYLTWEFRRDIAQDLDKAEK